MRILILVSILLMASESRAQPNVGAIANDELSVVYRGYDNIITAGAFGLPSNTKVYCDGCSSFELKEPGRYIAKVPITAKEITVRIQGHGIGMSKKFRVVSLPRPRCFVAGTDPFETEISRSQFSKGKLTVQLIGSPLSVPVSLIGGVLTITLNGISKSFPFKGNDIPAMASAIIKQLRPGGTVNISPKARVNGKEVMIPPITYKLK